MLGDKVGQIVGPVKTSVLPANGPNPRFTTSVEGSGTLAGINVNCMATYSSDMYSDGTLVAVSYTHLTLPTIYSV